MISGPLRGPLGGGAVSEETIVQIVNENVLPATETSEGLVQLAKGGQESPTDTVVVKSNDVRLLMAILFAF